MTANPVISYAEKALRFRPPLGHTMPYTRKNAGFEIPEQPQAYLVQSALPAKSDFVDVFSTFPMNLAIL